MGTAGYVEWLKAFPVYRSLQRTAPLLDRLPLADKRPSCRIDDVAAPHTVVTVDTQLLPAAPHNPLLYGSSSAGHSVNIAGNGET